MDRFLALLPPLASAAEMGAWDRAAVEFGLPEIMLMENAGHALLAGLGEYFGNLAGKKAAIFTGPGNNGGDGFCLARLLADCGASPFVFCYRKPEDLKGAAAYHAQLCRKAGIPMERVEALEGRPRLASLILGKMGELPDLLIDCLLGTGLARDLTPAMSNLVEAINVFAAKTRIAVAAVDIPTGLGSETGRPMPNAIKANLTVTLACAKRGLLLPHASPYCGQILCRGIGIPATLRDSLPPLWRLLDGRCLAAMPDLPKDSYKNQFGHVLVIGGAQGYSGAAHLACAAALRAGAGLVSACAPAANLGQIKSGWPEIMTMPACPGDSWSGGCRPETAFATSIVIGPGLTRSDAAAELLAWILQLPERPPCVVDADALILLAEREELLAKLRPGDALTPHPGEAAALLRCQAVEVQADRFAALEKLCAKTQAAIVLKGAATLVGQGADARLLSPYDIPDLAIGGAGDVLAGCIGALICKRRLPCHSAALQAGLGVALHALAAMRLAAGYPRRGFTASQLADALPQAWDFAKTEPVPAGATPWPARP